MMHYLAFWFGFFSHTDSLEKNEPLESERSSASIGFSVPITTRVNQQMKMTLSLTFEG